MSSKTRITAASAIAFIVLAAAQEPSQYAGTWQAKFKDSVVCTIRLTAGDKLSGSMSGCNINVDPEGNLIESAPSDAVDKPDSIVDVRVEKAVLRFAVKDADGKGTEFELKLADGDVAHLRVVNAPVPIKPIRFTRR